MKEALHGELLPKFFDAALHPVQLPAFPVRGLSTFVPVWNPLRRCVTSGALLLSVPPLVTRRYRGAHGCCARGAAHRVAGWRVVRGDVVRAAGPKRCLSHRGCVCLFFRMHFCLVLLCAAPCATRLLSRAAALCFFACLVGAGALDDMLLPSSISPSARPDPDAARWAKAKRLQVRCPP